MDITSIDDNFTERFTMAMHENGIHTLRSFCQSEGMSLTEAEDFITAIEEHAWRVVFALRRAYSINEQLSYKLIVNFPQSSKFLVEYMTLTGKITLHGRNEGTGCFYTRNSHSYAIFSQYRVEASSVEDFLVRYGKPTHFSLRGPEYMADCIKSHQEDFDKYGYTFITHHSSLCGKTVAFLRDITDLPHTIEHA